MEKQIKTLADMEKFAPRFGPEAVEFVRLKIEQAPLGRDEPVIADDTQIMFLFLELAERANAMEGKPI